MEINYCSQRCSNTIGSYVCSCYEGYQLDSDGETCNGMIYNIFITALNKFDYSLHVYQTLMNASLELIDVTRIARIHLDHTHAAVTVAIV